MEAGEADFTGIADKPNGHHFAVATLPCGTELKIVHSLQH